jgi:hypothetical protein
MVMVVFTGMCRPGPQYSVVTALGYGTRLIWLYTLNPY